MQTTATRLERTGPVGDRFRRLGGRRHPVGSQRVRRRRHRLDACRARCRHQLDRHRRGVRRRGLGAARGPGDRRPARRRADRHQGGASARGQRVPAPGSRAGGCRSSLERLGIEHIDLFSCTGPTRAASRSRTPGEPWARWSTKGLVRWIGVSNFDRDLIERCQVIRHVDSLQPPFSMLDLEHRDLIAWCGEAGRRASSRTDRWRSGC